MIDERLKYLLLAIDDIEENEDSLADAEEDDTLSVEDVIYLARVIKDARLGER